MVWVTLMIVTQWLLVVELVKFNAEVISIIYYTSECHIDCRVRSCSLWEQGKVKIVCEMSLH